MSPKGKERVALLPGSYDPITKGHMDVIWRTAGLFDRVVVAVMTNDMAKYSSGAVSKHYLFSMEERLSLARAACACIPSVEVIADGGMLVDLFDRVGATAIVKGVRSEADFSYEQKHAHWNRAHHPGCETLYLPADPALEEVSSTAVREALLRGEDISRFVPDAVVAEMEQLFGKRGER